MSQFHGVSLFLAVKTISKMKTIGAPEERNVKCKQIFGFASPHLMPFYLQLQKLVQLDWEITNSEMMRSIMKWSKPYEHYIILGEFKGSVTQNESTQ
jgi:outer membrane protease